MMGPLAGVGDPVFWFTARPILGALGASLAMGGSILGPILFFVLWNVIRWAFMWYTQEFGYNVGTKITEDLSGGLLQKVTKGASILGMFVLGALIERWVSINFTPVVSKVTLSKGAYIDWAKLPAGAEGIKTALAQQASGMALDPTKVTTLQDNLNSLIPGFVPLLLTLLCMWLLKKNVFSNHHHHRIIYHWYWWTRYRIIIRDDLAHIQKGPEVRAFCLYKKNIKNIS